MIEIKIVIEGTCKNGQPRIKSDGQSARILLSPDDYKDIQGNLKAFCECGLIVCDSDMPVVSAKPKKEKKERWPRSQDLPKS